MHGDGYEKKAIRITTCKHNSGKQFRVPKGGHYAAARVSQNLPLHRPSFEAVTNLQPASARPSIKQSNKSRPHQITPPRATFDPDSAILTLIHMGQVYCIQMPTENSRSRKRNSSGGRGGARGTRRSERWSLCQPGSCALGSPGRPCDFTTCPLLIVLLLCVSLFFVATSNKFENNEPMDEDEVEEPRPDYSATSSLTALMAPFCLFQIMAALYYCQQ